MTERTSAGKLALQALTAAAFALPGLATPAHAEDDQSFSIQYSHYFEGERNLHDQSYSSLGLKPIEVDSVSADANLNLTDRIKLQASYSQDSWSGATPVVSLPNAAVEAQLISGASSPNSFYTDRDHHPVVVDWDSYNPDTGLYQFRADPRLVHVMASASPETRQQASGALSYEWNRAELSAGGGLSEEHDYDSHFVNLGGKFDLERKLTTINWGLSYTWSRIHASLAANTAADWGAYLDQIRDVNGEPTIFGRRHDLAGDIGVTQILNKGALVQVDLGYTRSAGFLENPYKAVILGFDDPDQYVDASGLRYVPIKGVLEQRPNLRSQFALTVRYAQHVAPSDGALHAEYRLFRDNWGITANSLDLSFDQPLGGGWVMTPQARYYTQTAADFYRPYFVFDEAYPAHPGGPLDLSQVPLRYFSSDERLSGFGALSGGLTLEKRFENGIALDLAYEYYAHRGRLKLGGGGEGSYADFSSSLLTASLKLDLVRNRDARLGAGGEAGGAERLPAFVSTAPPGVLFADMLARRGELVFDIGYADSSAKGPLRFHDRRVDEQEEIDRACGEVACTLGPLSRSDHQLLFEFMYAPTDWLTLIAAPRLVNRGLVLKTLEPIFAGSGSIGPRPSGPDGSGSHSNGGWGDTTVLAAFRLLDKPGNHLQAALGLSVPTGRDGIRLNTKTDYASYALQLGSGTWDFTPNITWEGRTGGWSGGAQLAGVKRLQHRNDAGYRLGDEVTATAWGARDVTDWLSLSARVAYEWDGRIKGHFKPHLEHNVPEQETVQADWDVNGDGVVDSNDTEEITVYKDEMMPHVVAGPEDLPANYGGSFWDAGVGLTMTVPSGALQGDQFSVEWLQPIATAANGYQLSRRGTLTARVSVAL